MKIGICSDSHDHLKHLELAMAEFARRGVEAIVHAGDLVAPFTIDVLKKANCPVYAVFGNNDGEMFGLKKRFEELSGEINKEPHIYELDGLRFVVMHHPAWVNAFADELLADVVVYGHTHELHLEKRPPWIVNPGEIFGRLGAGPSVVVFDTETREPEVIWLKELKN